MATSHPLCDRQARAALAAAATDVGLTIDIWGVGPTADGRCDAFCRGILRGRPVRIAGPAAATADWALVALAHRIRQGAA